MSPVSEAKKKANERYTKKTYDEIKIRVPKGKKEVVQSHAEDMGESTNAFINRAIGKAIQRDKEIDQRFYWSFFMLLVYRSLHPFFAFLLFLNKKHSYQKGMLYKFYIYVIIIFR